MSDYLNYRKYLNEARLSLTEAIRLHAELTRCADGDTCHQIEDMRKALDQIIQCEGLLMKNSLHRTYNAP